MPVQTHQINLQGLSGGIFWTSLLAILFYAVGFSTCGWAHINTTWCGLWSSYTSSSHIVSYESWFKAVQAMACLGLIFLSLAFLLVFLYNFVHNVSMSKSLVLKLIVFCAFVAVICILVALAIFGTKSDSRNLHWSYAFAAIGGIFTLIAGILACVQMKRASII